MKIKRTENDVAIVIVYIIVAFLFGGTLWVIKNFGQFLSAAAILLVCYFVLKTMGRILLEL
ncbi:MAG: hypothetical protein KGI71_05935 [Patescibacteria group bacterium]|nr:hypothetical protein [Patescibacteria group bacterium]